MSILIIPLFSIGQFNEESQNFVSFVQDQFIEKSEAIQELSDVFLTYSLASLLEGDGVTWPYVTVPFDQFDKHARRVTSFPYDGIAFVAPVVSDVTNWNSYCAEVMSESNIPMSQNMFTFYGNGSQLVSGAGPFLPLHQVYPTPIFIDSLNGSIVNYDMSSDPEWNISATLANTFDQIVLSGLLSSGMIRDAYPDIFDATEPISTLINPILSRTAETSDLVGYAQSTFKWKSIFSKFDGASKYFYCTVDNTCGESFSFVVDQHNVTFTDSEYSTDLWINDISTTSYIGIKYVNVSMEDVRQAGICLYSITAYPTSKFRQEYDFNAAMYATIVGIILVFNLFTFFAFDQ